MAASCDEPPLDGPYIPLPPSEDDCAVDACGTVFLFFSVEGKINCSEHCMNYALKISSQTPDLGCLRRRRIYFLNGKSGEYYAQLQKGSHNYTVQIQARKRRYPHPVRLRPWTL